MGYGKALLRPFQQLARGGTVYPFPHVAKQETALRRCSEAAMAVTCILNHLQILLPTTLKVNLNNLRICGENIGQSNSAALCFLFFNYI